VGLFLFPGHHSFACFYRRETWSLTLRDENRQRVLENRVLRRIFGPEMEEIPEGWEKIA
jgi:hypothetical protein